MYGIENYDRRRGGEFRFGGKFESGSSVVRGVTRRGNTEISDKMFVMRSILILERFT